LLEKKIMRRSGVVKLEERLKTIQKQKTQATP
jgi:hypothetical protein